MTNIHELQAGFWKVHRHHDLRYYLDIQHSISNARSVQNPLLKCKYCKGYPFDMSSAK